MKKLAYLFLMTAITMQGQSWFDFEEEISDDWLQFPPGRWGVSDEFPLKGGGSLAHLYDNPSAGVDYIGRDFLQPSLNDTLSFLFRVRHGYNPSSGNNWQLFMLASQPTDLEAGALSGSAVLLGVNFFSSDDKVKLWQIKNGAVSEICTTELNYEDQIGVTGEPLFRVVRNPDGNWLIYCAVSGEHGSLLLIGSGQEDETSGGKYAGFRYAYTSAQDRKLWIDDFQIDGSFSRDTLPPMIVSSAVTGLNHIQLIFSEVVLISSLTNFACEENTLDNIIHEGEKVQLSFTKNFPNRVQQNIDISGISDVEGNNLSDTVITFRQSLAEFGDVVINEIMADPDPAVYLPACEYIELFNRCVEPISLDSAVLAINGKEIVLEDLILPGDYLIITGKSDHCVYAGSKQINLFSSETMLPNAGGEIRLYDRYGSLIHFVEYRETGGYDRSRGDGGWSLERIDPDYLCGGEENLAISVSWRGGTPGSVNSVLSAIADTEPPEILFAGTDGEMGIELIFSEPVLPAGEGNVIVESGNDHNIYSVQPIGEISESWSLLFAEQIGEKQLLQIELSDVTDCSGNIAETIYYPFSKPALPLPGNPVLNEVMYDPVAGGDEYIELYNFGEEFFDLADLKLRINKAGEDESLSFPVSKRSHLLPPESYVVLCSSSRSLREEWSLEPGIDILEIADWKALPDNGGCIKLLDKSENVVGEFCYSDSFHNDLIGNYAGISLELISPEACSYEAYCWTSASAASGYGTPGRENSQYIRESEAAKKPVLTPEVFSPDDDGFEDILMISLPDNSPGSLVDIYITDINGNLVNQLICRGITGSSDIFFWDGMDQEGRIVLPGIYIVHIHLMGEKRKDSWKKGCAVYYRL